MKKVCIATSTRADWGILHPLAVALRDSGKVCLQILATNMHLLESYGKTIDNIIADGFTVDAKVPMPESGDNPAERAYAMGECLIGTARELTRINPDALIILGDRYEMLAVASAATLLKIPVIHLHGGEISEGAIDDSMRHAITKLASLHLTATEQYRQRVIQLGEQPSMVVNAGSLGVWNIMHTDLIPREELFNDLGIDSKKRVAVATFHPATLDSCDAGVRCKAMTDALDCFSDVHVIITYPNNDAGSQSVIDVITAWAAKHTERVTIVKSLGLKRFLSAVACSEFVIGNSSAGIIEVPSLKVPVVNIGIRQQGRIHAEPVIDCGDGVDEIVEAISKAMSPEMKKLCQKCQNPYYKDNTLQLATNAVLEFVEKLPIKNKKFYDLPQE